MDATHLLRHRCLRTHLAVRTGALARRGPSPRALRDDNEKPEADPFDSAKNASLPSPERSGRAGWHPEAEADPSPKALRDDNEKPEADPFGSAKNASRPSPRHSQGGQDDTQKQKRSGARRKPHTKKAEADPSPSALRDDNAFV